VCYNITIEKKWYCGNYVKMLNNMLENILMTVMDGASSGRMAT
jgi:hypothetical protein